MANVIRVQIVHHKGGRPRGPAFELQAAARARCADHATMRQAATLTSGRLTVRVAKGPDWRVEFMDGDRVITSSGWRGMALMETPEGRFILEQLTLGVGECVYGLGERFTPFVKNGQVVDLWNEDGGTASELAYKNIPFYLTNRGYGVFVNHPEKVSLRGRVREGRAGAVQRARRVARLLRDLRPDAEGGARAATPRSPAGPRCRPRGRSGCGSPPRSPPTTTRRPSPASSRAWPTATCRCTSSTSTASG